MKNTLNVGRISEGFVLDHIEAGKSMDIYKYLHLDKLDCCVAIIKNARSSKMGKKDIMKIECPIDLWTLIFSDLSTTISQSILSPMNRSSTKNPKTSKRDHQCDPLQKPKMYHIHRAGTGSHLCPDRRREPGVPLQILRRKILRKINKKTNGNVVFTDHVPVIYLKILWQYMSRT